MPPSMSSDSNAPPNRTPQQSAPTTLSLQGRDLINALVDDLRSKHFPVALAQVKSLRLLNLDDWRINNDIFSKFFQLLRSLPKLQDLTVSGFSIPPFSSRLSTPGPVFLFPLAISKLTLVNTSGKSLKLMLNCIQATEVVLQCCSNILSLPHCETLRLVGIREWGHDARRELLTVFSAWDGCGLVVEECPFFDDVFALLLGAHMRLSGKAMWPSARDLWTRGCPATMAEVDEMLKVRERLLCDK